MKKIFKWFGLLVLTLITFVLVFGVYFNFIHPDTPNPNTVFGVSYSTEYAGYLHLNVRQAYTALLDDWKFRYIRLAAQWNQLEPKKGEFDFHELDWLMDEAGKRGAKVVLTVGHKTPRWPECHDPAWANGLTGPEHEAAYNNYFKTVIERYKNHPALEMWQVENEPFVAFGVCDLLTPGELKAEVATVKSMDPNHPTLSTDSGELGVWYFAGHSADYFGTTLYRVVWGRWLGYWNYNWLPGAYYRWKLFFTGIKPERAFVSELQAEPWIPGKPINEVPITEQYKSMSLAQLQKNVRLSASLGMPRVYLWGAEWWYWLQLKGLNEIPAYVSGLKKE